MAFENTITEKDLDKDGLAFVDGLRDDGDPDFDVDGMSDSILARILRRPAHQNGPVRVEWVMIPHQHAPARPGHAHHYTVHDTL